MRPGLGGRAGPGQGCQSAAGRAPAHTSWSLRHARPRAAASVRSCRAFHGGLGPRPTRGGPGAAAAAAAAAADGSRPAQPGPRPRASGR